jgi:protein involved in polysaccharide export with SLBB domain
LRGAVCSAHLSEEVVTAMPQLYKYRTLYTVTTIVAMALFAACAINFCSTARADGGPEAANPTMVAPIGPNDTLHIEVMDQTDLTQDYQVDANGDITMLYVGKIHVGGDTPDEATQLVTNTLGKIYVSPQVTLNRVSIGGSSISISGDVQHQGSQTVRRDAHLNDVVQLSIPNTDSDLSKILITRGLPGQTHTQMSIDLASFLSGGDQTGNPQLEDGDTIFVPSKAPISYSVSVVGAVAKPGQYMLPPGSTVYDAVRQAGGLLDSADKPSLYVQPMDSLDRHPFDYDKARQAPEDPDSNPLLNDGDKIVVPEAVTAPIFSITGAVMKPGQYPIENPIVSLTDAEGMAGGLQDRAKIDQVVVTRDGPNGAAKIIKLNTKDPQVAADFQLQAGDNVYIPQGHAKQPMDPLSALGAIGSILTLGRL